MPAEPNDLLQNPVRILHLEDSVTDAELIQGALTSEEITCDIRCVKTREEFAAALEQENFDLILSDYSLPDFDGRDALRMARKRRPGTPFIFVSGTIGEERAVESLKGGAVDYVIKDSLHRLTAAVRRALRERREWLERERIEAELRQQNELFRQITQSVDDLIAVLDVRGYRVFNSPSYGKLGMNPAGLAGTDSFEDIHPEDRERIRRIFHQTVATGRGQRTEYRFLLKDGSTRHIESQGSAIRDKDGRVANVVVISRDVTERNRVDMKIREQAALLDQALDAIFVRDLGRRITYWNRGAERLYGWSAAEVLDRHRPDLLSNLDSPEHDELWKAVLERGEWTGELSHVTKSGKEITVVSRQALLRDPSGRPMAVLSTNTDVTAKKQLEEQLRRSQKMEAFGQLAGGVAHDFNNMLAVIHSSAELLLMDEGRLNGQDRAVIGQIIGASERAANLTRRLLIFSRKEVMQSLPVALNDLIANLAKMLRRVLREDIRLETVFANGLAFIQGDPGMMEQAIVNLVLNARDAMPRGGQLTIRTEKIAIDKTRAGAKGGRRDGDFVCLTVSDTGTGIAPEHLDRIFEPFFTTKEPGKGTGLGLATLYGIVKEHQGWVEVSSRVGEGTAFQIFLPAIPSSPERPAATAAEADPQGKGETVLLAEDDDAVRMTTRRALETHGFKVYEAASVAEARELWRAHGDEIALLLADIVMPEGVSGRGLADELRKERPGLKVVFMTGYSAEAAGKDTDFFHRPKTRLLHKPFPVRTLALTVRQCLDEN